MTTLERRESVVMNCDTESRPVHLYGKDHGLTQRGFSTDAAGSGDICDRLEVVAPEARR